MGIKIPLIEAENRLLTSRVLIKCPTSAALKLAQLRYAVHYQGNISRTGTGQEHNFAETQQMKTKQQIPLNILLADDDTDDRYFFAKALEAISVPVILSTVENGELLISRLIDGREPIPDVLFLDLNMPKKNGAECLTFIKGTKKLDKLPVIIYSTSLHNDVADLLYDAGAHYYIKKAELKELKKTLMHVLPAFFEKEVKRPSRDKFVISLYEVDH